MEESASEQFWTGESWWVILICLDQISHWFESQREGAAMEKTLSPQVCWSKWNIIPITCWNFIQLQVQLNQKLSQSHVKTYGLSKGCGHSLLSKLLCTCTPQTARGLTSVLDKTNYFQEKWLLWERYVCFSVRRVTSAFNKTGHSLMILFNMLLSNTSTKPTFCSRGG